MNYLKNCINNSVSVKEKKNIQDLVKGFQQVREAHRRELIYDYVELISDLTIEFGEARQVDMALRLGVSQPTVAKMLKKLCIAGLTEQIPYRGVFLTNKGHQLAKESRFRHNIVEKFLLALGISSETALRDSEGIEHHVSEETLKVFKKFYEKH